MSEKKKGLIDFALLGRIIRLTEPYKRIFYSSVLLSCVLALLTPVRPMLVMYTVNHFFIANMHITLLGNAFNGLAILCIGMLAILVLDSILRYTFGLIISLLGQNIIRDLRIRVFDHVLHQRLKYFDTTPIGTSTTRTISDIEAVNDTFSEGLISIVADILTIAAVLIVMFVTNWKLALASISTLPLLLFITRWFQEGVKRSFQEERTQIARLNAFLQEHITGMRIIQIFNAEKKEQAKFQLINAALRDATVRGIWYYSLFFPAVEILSAGAVGIMVWIASRQILHHEENIGVIMAYILFIAQLYRPLRFIADKVNTIQRGLVASERVFKLIDTDDSIPNNGKYAPAHLEGKIEFSHVWFAYNDENYVLRDVSFTLEAGETLAIVGATGSGKTSTISLLGRFYEINRGEIKVDDVPLQEFELNILRKQMSIVLQDVFLFAGSVHDNITLRNENISREEVIRCAKLVGAHDFIAKLPGGYDYEVMERGATLSMGQRQLISFVRALVYNPRILILDEATSSIDSESEAIIQTAIEKLVKGRTSIVIAHRLSTIRHAHKIAVLDKGALKEFGSHEELLAKNGYYRKLHDMQFMSQASLN